MSNILFGLYLPVLLLLVLLAWRYYPKWKGDTEISEWYSKSACKFCLTFLSVHQKMYSGGVCPHCGRKGKSAGTIVDCKVAVIRSITTYKRFKQTTVYEGRDELSTNILRRNKY